MADSLNSDPRSSNVDPATTPSIKKTCKNPILDRPILKSCDHLRRSPRIVTTEPEKRSLAEIDDDDGEEAGRRKKKTKMGSEKKKKMKNEEEEAEVDCELDLRNLNGKTSFVGDPVPEEEAWLKWPHRYGKKVKTCNNWNNIAKVVDDDGIVLKVKCHYLQANVNGCIFNIGDCAYVKGEKKKPNYVGRILEFFETIRGENYVRVQWFYRAEDTVMKEQAACHDKKRLFYSDLANDNLLDCLVSKVRVVQVPPRMHNSTESPSSPNKHVDLKTKSLPSCYFYYDMKYSVDYFTFQTMEINDSIEKSDLSSSNCSGTNDVNDTEIKVYGKQAYNNCESKGKELSLLDLYAGCGGMSTGLCLGAQVAGAKLVARRAVDFNEPACQSLKLNHPETQVRNEAAVDFYELLKEWDTLCKRYVVDADKNRKPNSKTCNVGASRRSTCKNSSAPPEEYEVLKLVDICYGDPTESGKRGLKFKVLLEVQQLGALGAWSGDFLLSVACVFAGSLL